MITDTADLPQGSLASELRQWVHAVEVSGRAVLPDTGSELLQTIVEAAARLFGAAASSIALLDGTQSTLEFRVATGAGAGEVVGLRIPVGQGIAGYVVVTGQPLAVSSVDEDPRFARETAKKTGYVPRSILAMPLLYQDRPIGVIEVLDKIDAPSFGIQDMELLGIFARQAAIAIRGSMASQHIGQALLAGISRLVEDGAVSPMPNVEQALAGPEPTPAEAEEIVAFADILSQLGRMGEAERQSCVHLVRTFLDYAQSRMGVTDER